MRSTFENLNQHLFLCVVSFAIFVYSTAFALADDAAVNKYRNYLPNQIDALPDSIKKSELPIMYSQAAATASSPWAQDQFAMQLNILMYNGMADYKSAISSFQKDLGDKPTGELTVWQIFQLNFRSAMQTTSAPSIVHNFMSTKTSDAAFVKGTMTIVDDKIFSPMNFVKLRCFRSDGYCELDELDVQPPKQKDFGYDYSVFWTDVLYYKISIWADDVIQAQYEAPKDSCRSTTMELNFKTKEFYLITKNTGNSCEILGQKLEPLKKPRISQIVDGEKIISLENKRFKDDAFSYLSSEFRQRIQKLQSSNTGQ